MVTEKQAFEWVKTGHWSLADFKAWMAEVREDAAEAAKWNAEMASYSPQDWSGHG